VTTKAGGFPNRMPALVTPAKVEDWMERLKPSLNLEAAPKEPFGIKFHPE